MSAGKAVLLSALVLLTLLLLAAVRAFFRRPLAVHAFLGRRELRSAGLVRREISGPAGRLRYWKGGSGPLLVLLHGAGDEAATWSAVAAPLAKKRTLLVPDLPGHGASEPANGPLRFATLLAGLEALVDREAPREKLILAGNSLGAWLAFAWAGRHPERAARIVAVNGGPLLGESPVGLVPRSRAEARTLVEMLRAPGSVRVPDFVLDDIVRSAPTGPIARLASGGDLAAFLMDEARLRSFPVPVDLLWGEADRVVPLSYARRMAAALPAVRLRTLGGCGHVPHQELPASFARALAELLDEPPPAGSLREAS